MTWHSKETIVSCVSTLLVAFLIIIVAWGSKLVPSFVAIGLAWGSLIISIALLTIGLAMAQQFANKMVLTWIIALALVGAGRISLISCILMPFVASLFWWGGQRVQQEMKNRSIYHTIPIFHIGVRRITIGFVIAVLGIVYPIISAATTTEALTVTPRFVQKILIPLEPSLGIPFGNTNDLSVQVAQMLNNYFHPILNEYRAIIPGLIIAAVLLTLRALLPFLMWPSLLLIIGLIWVARKAGVLQLTTVNRPVQYLSYT